MKITVGLGQIRTVPGDVETNLAKIEKYVSNASKKDVELIVFPELSVAGYMAQDLILDLAEPIPGKVTSRLEKIAREYNMYLVAGFPEFDLEKKIIYNSAILVGPEGIVGIYRKRHLPSYGIFDESRYFKPYRSVFKPFNTRLGKIGIVICYDLFFPETTRILALMGTDILVVPSAAPDMSKDHFETFVKARAMENTIFVIYVNMVGFYRGIGFFGGSHIRGPLGDLIYSLDTHVEKLGIATIDDETLTRARIIRPIIGDINFRDFQILSEKFG